MTMMYTDRELRCRVCGRNFVFSAGEQQYFDRRGFQAPSRCPDCRASDPRRGRAPVVRHREPTVQTSVVGPAPSLPKRAWDVTCFRCGAETKVAFLPREDALVYCQACLDEVFSSLRRTRPSTNGRQDANGDTPLGVD